MNYLCWRFSLLLRKSYLLHRCVVHNDFLSWLRQNWICYYCLKSLPCVPWLMYAIYTNTIRRSIYTLFVNNIFLVNRTAMGEYIPQDNGKPLTQLGNQISKHGTMNSLYLIFLPETNILVRCPFFPWYFVPLSYFSFTN